MTNLMSAVRLSLVLGLVIFALAVIVGSSAQAAPVLGPAAVMQERPDIVPVRSKLREFFESLTDDDDDYVHDNHYDAPWNSMSRKDKIRAYQEMQWEAQKDYAKQLKQKQKELIKRQRGW